MIWTRTGRLLFCLLPALTASTLLAQEPERKPDGEIQTIAVSRWLVYGPVAVPRPVFANERPGRFTAAELLKMDNRSAELRTPEDPGWVETDALRFARQERPQVVWAAFRVTVDRFTEADLVVTSPMLLRAWLDGRQVASKEKADSAGQERPGNAKGELKLEPGSHLVVVKGVAWPDTTGSTPAGDWTIQAKLERSPKWQAAELELGLDRSHALTVENLLDTESISWVRLSPDGTVVALELKTPAVPSDDAESWVELRAFETGRLIRSTRGLESISGFQWRPGGGREFSYVVKQDKRSTVFVADLEGGPVRKVLSDVLRLGSYRWMPDGQSLVYSVSEEPKKDDRGVKRMRGLADRWPEFRKHDHLHQIDLGSGVRRRLTAGSLGAEVQDLHTDGARLLFSRKRYGLTERPFSEDELYELDLTTLRATRLLVSKHFSGATYEPGGDRILIRGGLELLFENEGGRPEGYVPNSYDEQLFLLAPDGKLEALTREFDPAVESVVWSPHDGRIYLRATVGPRQQIYRFDPEGRQFEQLDAGVDVVSNISVAERAARLAAVGSSAALPPRLMALDLEGGAPRMLLVPGAKTWKEVTFGRIETWTFESTAGDTIDGFVYYPRDFDPNRRYPLIVYYYGGTSPSSRVFGGRYPCDLWAAHGYVVYVLNPSGATGYGQEFSDRHVNNWGQTVAGEIIEGTNTFVEAHPFVDPSRVGCIGASYGGFMTMLLLTRTDRFAAAVAHAGISSLSSYWGEGFWGYLYSAVATADSYPWNRPDLYVGQSPLFQADRIHTPLLLLHGESDTNVPVGESEQLYTALRVLGRDVEFLKFADQDHHILTYPVRKLWMKTIVAWFDWKLKGQREWWDELYPDPNEADEEPKDEEQEQDD